MAIRENGTVTGILARHTHLWTEPYRRSVPLNGGLRSIHAAPGCLMGPPATNKPFTPRAIAVLRIVDGKIVEVGHQEDLLGLMRRVPGGPN